MAVTFAIRWDEGPYRVQGSRGNSVIRYVATSNDPDNEDRDAVMAALLSAAPASIYGMFAQNYVVSERVSDNEGDAKWFCEVIYSDDGQIQPAHLSRGTGERPYRYSVRSGSNKVDNNTQSYALHDERADSNAYLFDGTILERALGLKIDNREKNSANLTIEGIGVPTAVMEIHVETVASNNEVLNSSFAFNGSFHAGNNAVNSDNWNLYPTGSLKITSFNCNQRGTTIDPPSLNSADWDVNWTFEYQPDVEVPLADGFIGEPMTKPGHYYLERMYKPTIETVNGAQLTLYKEVRQAIHQIYPEVSFATDLLLPPYIF